MQDRLDESRAFLSANKSKVLNVQGQTRPQSSDHAHQVQRGPSSDVLQRMSVRECFKGSTCGAAQQQTYLSSGEDCPQWTTASLLLVKRHSIQRKRCVEMCLSTQICQGLGLSPSLPLSNTHTHTHSFNQRHHCCCSPAGTERDALMLVEAKKSAGIA